MGASGNVPVAHELVISKQKRQVRNVSELFSPFKLKEWLDNDLRVGVYIIFVSVNG